MKKPVKRAKKSAMKGQSEVVAIVNDIHFDLHDPATWNAFKAWAKATKPAKVVVLGDFLDLGMISRYEIGQSDPLFAIPQIQCFVAEMEELSKYTKELVIIEGNHDERWAKYLAGSKPFALRGAIGLSLKEQCFAQGLTKKAKWMQEDMLVRGVQVGPFLLRHGHNQARGFGGGGKHLAANKIMKSMGENEVFGHHHKAQLFCQTSGGKTAIAIANPCMTGTHGYDIDPNWQRGFTVLDCYGPGNKYATPHLVIAQDGHFSYNGIIYDGNV